MKYTFILLSIVSTSLFAETVHIKNFNVLQSLNLNEVSKVRKNKAPFKVKPGMHQIRYRKDDGLMWDSLNITFLALGKTAKFKIASPLFIAIKDEDSFVLPAQNSLQGYSITSNVGKPKIVKTWDNKTREYCVLKKLEKEIEVCEPAMDYIPFTFRDKVQVRGGGSSFCYKKPTTEIIWGKQFVYYKHRQTQAEAIFKLISGRGNEIVAQGNFLKTEIESKRIKADKCN